MRFYRSWTVLAVVAVSAVATSWSLYQQNAAMARAQLRENRLTAYLTAASARSQRTNASRPAAPSHATLIE